MGMNIRWQREEVYIPACQVLQKKEYKIEPDMSSCFALAAAACLGGEARFVDFPEDSLQPDFRFLDILDYMGAEIDERWKWTRFLRSKNLEPIEVDLEDSPDLFPVLAVLCAFAAGRSRLYGAGHLKYKESNRLDKTCELLTQIRVHFTQFEDGIEIDGPFNLNLVSAFSFDPDQDHRMAMAAGLLKKAGVPVSIVTPEVVNKSFPEFFKILGVSPR